MKLTLLIAGVLVAVPAFGIQKCTTADGKAGEIGHEVQMVPNFAGKLVAISVEYCGYKGGKAFAGYHYSSITVKPSFGGNVGAVCNGPTCAVPREGVAVLQQLQALTVAA